MRALPYRIGVDDRIVIKGEEFRLRSANAEGWVFERVDMPDRVLGLTVDQFKREMQHPDFRLDPGGLSAGRVAVGLASPRDLSALPPKEVPGILLRLGYVHHFTAMEGAGEATRSDAGMDVAVVRIQAVLERERVERNARITSERSEGRAKRKLRVDAPVLEGVQERPVALPSGRTLLRWIRRYEAGGRTPMALRLAHHRCGNSEHRVQPEVLPLLVDAAQGYMSLQRPTRATCLWDLRVKVRQLNLERVKAGLPEVRCPSRRALEERIAALDKFELYAARHGREKAVLKFAALGSGLDVTRPGERIEMDEWDVHAVTLLQRAKLWEGLDAAWRETAERHRLVACVAECAKSRLAMGVSFSSVANTAENAIACLAMVVSDKTRLAKWAGACSPWNQACTPESVVTDGGSGFTSDSFRAAVSELTGQGDVPPAGAPQMRGRIERLLLTLEQELMPWVPGRTFSNVVERGDYDSEARAAILDVVLKKLVIVFLVDVYNNKPHSGLKGATPANEWSDLQDEFGLVPLRGAEVRRNALGVELSRKTGRHGVRVLGLNYSCERIQKLFRDRGVQDVAVRMDPLDLGRVSVRVAEGWLTCTCLQRRMSGVTMTEWVAAEADLRWTHKARAKLSEGVVLDAIQRIKDVVDDAAAQFGLGGARPTARDVDRLQAEIRIFFPPPLGLDDAEPPQRDLKRAAVPRGTKVETYAIIQPEPDEEGGPTAAVELEPYHEFEDEEGDGTAVPEPAPEGDDMVPADPGENPRSVPANEGAPLAGPPDDVHEIPFHEFEDDDE